MNKNTLIRVKNQFGDSLIQKKIFCKRNQSTKHKNIPRYLSLLEISILIKFDNWVSYERGSYILKWNFKSKGSSIKKKMNLVHILLQSKSTDVHKADVLTDFFFEI